MINHKLKLNKVFNEQGIAHVGLILLLLIVIGVVGFAGFKVIKEQKNKNTVNSQNGDVTKDCQGNGMVKMTHMPMDLKDVNTILPVGTLAGAHVTPIDHLYFYPKDMTNRDAAPVYAMADGYIVNMQVRSQQVDTGQSQKDEYRLMIQHNCDTASYFDLLTSLDPSIKDQLQPNASVRVPIKAGQVVGRVGAQSLDTAIYNYGMELKGFVNPASYEAEPWKIHTDDFFTYFNEDLRNQMLVLNPRKVAPFGGKIDYDVSGKLVGNWFQEGTNGYAGPKEYQNGNNPGGGKGYWNGHFSIAPDAIDPSLTDISFGDYQGQAQQFTARKGSPDPATIGAEAGVVKYEMVKFIVPSPSPTGGKPAPSNTVLGTVLFQVLDGDKMKMEAFPNKTAAQVVGFTAAAKVYTR